MTKTPKDALAEVREILDAIAKRPNLPNPDRDADWKNCQKWSSHDAEKALQILDSIEVVGESEAVEELQKRHEKMVDHVVERSDPHEDFEYHDKIVQACNVVRKAIKDAGFLVLRGKK